MAINIPEGTGTVITQADAWRINSSFMGNANPISSNWERVDGDSFLKIGDGMSQSSGIFTFPKTGIWQITAIGSFFLTNGRDSRYNGVEMEQTQNNSDWGNAARFYANIGTESGTGYTNGICQHIFDVQNTSNYKIKFKTEVANSDTFFDANTAHSQNLFTFIRIGDT
tara:strand:- start:361 stop:864 length:504 start_codon:yes stop_codon:yes gene_type:complete